MVWVSNQSSVDIRVHITNNTGGSACTFTIYPKQIETWRFNCWTRDGNETATIELASGKTTEIEVGKDAYLKVFNDTLLMETFTATQIWLCCGLTSSYRDKDSEILYFRLQLLPQLVPKWPFILLLFLYSYA